MIAVISLGFFIILLGFEFLYFKIARKFNITDSPNHRSSHTKITIRGGGIIFVIGFLLSWCYSGFHYTYFLAGLLLIGAVSFIDDIKEVSKRIRILLHFAGAALLLYQVGLYNYPFYLVPLVFLFVIATINGINFMDGINGITGGYSLLLMATLLYINRYIIQFTGENYLLGVITALLVFNFFNFRKNARCFAGDVGSVSIAFIIAFFVLQLIIKSGQPAYLLLLTVYIVDTVTTIFFRLIRKENIFEAHRSHFYQFLANEKKIPHLSVAGLYVAVQAVINTFIIFYPPAHVVIVTLLVAISTILFIAIRLVTEGRKRILNI